MPLAATLSKEDLYSILSDVFDSMLEVGIEQSDGHLQDFGAGRMALASVSITGGWQGVIHVQCPYGLASALAGAMFKADAGPLAQADIQDAMGEIVNMIGGNIKAKMPGPSGLSLPNVVLGTDCLWNVPGGREIQRMISRCLNHDLLVTVFEDRKH